MEIEWLDSVGSTNAWLKENATPPMTLICARSQTAGRGQRGNSWEAEPGKNLTFSFWFQPRGVVPAAQFAISEAIALAMTDTLAEYGIVAKVKWPNDIYVGDRKIAGILIENSITGCNISRSIAGIGLNVNQTLFISDAPNPVSMSMLTGKDYDLREVAGTAGRHLSSRLMHTGSHHEDYMASLWRGDGRLYPFRESASGESFLATIEVVLLSGHLKLRRSDGSCRHYAFKEVVFL